jgi:hypothetical protein
MLKGNEECAGSKCYNPLLPLSAGSLWVCEMYVEILRRRFVTQGVIQILLCASVKQGTIENPILIGGKFPQQI